MFIRAKLVNLNYIHQKTIFINSLLQGQQKGRAKIRSVQQNIVSSQFHQLKFRKLNFVKIRFIILYHIFSSHKGLQIIMDY